MIFSKQNNKGFTLIEVLIIVAVVGILITILQVSSKNIKNRALDAQGQANRIEAGIYCASHPGESILNGDVVYCDQYDNMWAPTLASTYQWSTESVDIITKYNIPNDCNEIPLGPEGLDKYPACKACVTLDYAGFSEGWRLPSHSDVDGGNYCWPNSQLWRYGEELCQDKDWGIICSGSPGPSPCTPSWEETGVASADLYWSATQDSGPFAWSVYFTNAKAFKNYGKATARCVRCFLGE